MNKTTLVMVQEIRTTLRRKVFVFLGFGIPILMGIIALIIGWVNRDATTDFMTQTTRGAMSSTQVPEGFVDEGDLIQFIPDNVDANRLKEYGDINKARMALEEEKIGAFYIIDPDYLVTGLVTYVKLSHNPFADDVTTEQIQWILLANLVGDQEAAYWIMNPIAINTISLAPAHNEEVEEGWIVELLPNLMALMLYLVIIMASSTLITAVTDEKKNHVMEVLISSLSTDQLISGKILALGILGLMMILIWIGVFWGVVQFGGQPLAIPEGFALPSGLLIWTLIYGLLGYALYGAQMAGVGALVPDIKDSRSLSFVVLAPLIAVYVFLIVIIANPNGPIAIVLSFFPLTSPVAMIARMVSTEIALWQPLLAAVIQIIAVIMIVKLVARLFRAQTLLSGQPVSVKHYYRILLGR